MKGPVFIRPTKARPCQNFVGHGDNFSGKGEASCFAGLILTFAADLF